MKLKRVQNTKSSTMKQVSQLKSYNFPNMKYKRIDSKNNAIEVILKSFLESKPLQNQKRAEDETEKGPKTQNHQQ